jgi:hypothetical protein
MPAARRIRSAKDNSISVNNTTADATSNAPIQTERLANLEHTTTLRSGSAGSTHAIPHRNKKRQVSGEMSWLLLGTAEPIASLKTLHSV